MCRCVQGWSGSFSRGLLPRFGDNSPPWPASFSSCLPGLRPSTSSSFVSLLQVGLLYFQSQSSGLCGFHLGHPHDVTSRSCCPELRCLPAVSGVLWVTIGLSLAPDPHHTSSNAHQVTYGTQPPVFYAYLGL